MEDHNIPSLCHLFCELVASLECSRPVFCIIDDSSEMETVLRGWQGDTCLIFETLLGLVDNDQRVGPALKVLLTSPERSINLADTVIPSDGRVSLLAARMMGGQTSLSKFRREVGGMLMADDVDELSSSETLDMAGSDDISLRSSLPQVLDGSAV